MKWGAYKMKNGYVGMETATGTDGRPCVIVRRQVGGDGIRDTWLMALAHAMGYTGQQLRLVRWIIDHADGDGYLPMAQRAIAKKSGVSIATVARAFQMLQGGDAPFIVSADGGGYRINPDIVQIGSDGSLPRIVLDFSPSPAPKEPAPKEEVEKVETGDQDIDELQRIWRKHRDRYGDIFDHYL